MNFFSNVMNFLIMMIFLRVLFTIMSTVRMVFRTKNRTKIDTTPPSPFLEAIGESQVSQTVMDEHCGVAVPKNEAYMIMEDEGPRYFCSWECRQDYIAKKKDGRI